jgi:hypothetical protein
MERDASQGEAQTSVRLRAAIPAFHAGVRRYVPLLLSVFLQDATSVRGSGAQLRYPPASATRQMDNSPTQLQPQLSSPPPQAVAPVTDDEAPAPLRRGADGSCCGGRSRPPALAPPDATLAPSDATLAPAYMTLAFRCRAGITRTGDPPREGDVLVEYNAGSVAGRGEGAVAVRKVFKGLPGRHPHVFLVKRCAHITDKRDLRKSCCLVVQFEKVDGGAGGRTKVASVSLRGWAAGDVALVERLWGVLSAAAGANGSPKGRLQAEVRPPRSIADAARRTCAPVTVDGKLRATERKRAPSFSARGRAGGARLLQRMDGDGGGGSPSAVAALGIRTPAVAKPVVQRGGGGKYAAMGRATDGILGRLDTYAAANAIADGLIGRPPGANQPLRATKSERMRARARRGDLSGGGGRGQSMGTQGARRTPSSQGAKRVLVLAPQPQGGRPEKRTRLEAPPPGRSVGFGGPHAGEMAEVAKATAARECVVRERVMTERAARLAGTDGNGRPARSRVSPRGGESDGGGGGGGGGGILNLGNTCYLGAALQALLGDETFVRDVATQVRGGEPSAAPFARSLIGMAGSRRADSASRLNPELVRSAIAAHFKEFGTAAQQDVQEFVTRCLSVLERELGDDVTRCPVSRNFSLVLENRHSCTACGRQFDPRRELLRDMPID